MRVVCVSCVRVRVRVCARAATSTSSSAPSYPRSHHPRKVSVCVCACACVSCVCVRARACASVCDVLAHHSVRASKRITHSDVRLDGRAGLCVVRARAVSVCPRVCACACACVCGGLVRVSVDWFFKLFPTVCASVCVCARARRACACVFVFVSAWTGSSRRFRPSPSTAPYIGALITYVLIVN